MDPANAGSCKPMFIMNDGGGIIGGNEFVELFMSFHDGALKDGWYCCCWSDGFRGGNWNPWPLKESGAPGNPGNAGIALKFGKFIGNSGAPPLSEDICDGKACDDGCIPGKANGWPA